MGQGVRRRWRWRWHARRGREWGGHSGCTRRHRGGGAMAGPADAEAQDRPRHELLAEAKKRIFEDGAQLRPGADADAARRWLRRWVRAERRRAGLDGGANGGM